MPEAPGGLQEAFGGLQEALGGVWEVSGRLLEAKLANSLVFSRVSCSPPGAPRDPLELRQYGKWRGLGRFPGATGSSKHAYLLQDSRIVDSKLQSASLQDLQSAFYQSTRTAEPTICTLPICKDWKLPLYDPDTPCLAACWPSRGRRICVQPFEGTYTTFRSRSGAETHRSTDSLTV